MRIDGQEITKPARSYGKVLALAGLLVVMGGIVALSFWGRDVQEDAPRLISHVWRAESGGARRLYFLMEEKRALRGYFDSDANHSYSLPYSIFTLHSRKGLDGSSPASRVIARTDGGTVDMSKYQVSLHLIHAPEILGPQGDVLWMWSDGLEARSLDTLELVWTTAKLKELNPELGQFLPTDRKYFKVLDAFKALTYKGSDARYFQIEPRDGKIRVIENTTLAAKSREYVKTAESAMWSLHDEGQSLWGTSVGGLMWDSLVDVAGKTWYGLLAEDEKAPTSWRDPKYGFGPSGEVARLLFRARVSFETSSATNIQHVNLDPASVTKLGDTRFLMGGYLRRPNTERVWIVGESAGGMGNSSAVASASLKGKSFLVLHRNALGKDSPWFVTRVGTDGTVIWTCSTGLADVQDLSDGHGSVVFTGYADFSEPTGKRPDLMVFIDEESGKSQVFNLEAESESEGL